jgi:xylulokinase
MTEVTVGVDIGTSSVKAVAADGDGNVVASARVPHAVHVPTPDRFEHDATVAWRDGPRAALDALGDLDVRGVSVAAMVPSLTAVDPLGRPIAPGLLYGDARGRRPGSGAGASAREPGIPASSERVIQGGVGDDAAAGFFGFVEWLAAHTPNAHGYWPAQAVANHAFAGEAVLDTTTAATAHPLFDWSGWDDDVARDLGARADQFPRLVPTGWEAARVGGPDGPALAPGCVDAFAEQLVAGADRAGDVLVLLGTTLITWVVVEEDAAVPGYVTVPHTSAGHYLAGGPSNAGGLFRDWVVRLVGDGAEPTDQARVPVWAPYPRGERVPLNDAARRAALDGLDLTHDAGAIVRAADEASAFVVRRAIETVARHTGVRPARIVASGGGTRVSAWVQALADATGLPVDVVAVPEGAALGSAWLARMAAGLEDPMAMTEARRWARVGRRVEPRPAWAAAASPRYEHFLALSAPAGA